MAWELFVLLSSMTQKEAFHIYPRTVFPYLLASTDHGVIACSMILFCPNMFFIVFVPCEL